MRLLLTISNKDLSRSTLIKIKSFLGSVDYGASSDIIKLSELN